LKLPVLGHLYACFPTNENSTLFRQK
jgi:hypothetical protein